MAEVVVEPEQDTEIRASFWDLVGRLDLTVVPWAEVYLDDNYIGDTPLEKALVMSPGSHEIMLNHPALGEWEYKISVSAGEVITRSYNLNEVLGQ